MNFKLSPTSTPSETAALSLMCSAGCGAKTKASNIWPGTGTSIQRVPLTESAHKPHTRCIELLTRWKSWRTIRQKRISKNLDACQLEPKRAARHRKEAEGAQLKSDGLKGVDRAMKQGLQIQGKTCQNKATHAFGR